MSEDSFAPYLTCQFVNPDTGDRATDLALVDTGANGCVVSMEFAKHLGHNIKKGRWGHIWTASDQVTSWKHTFTIHIYAMQTRGSNEIFVDKNDIVLTLENIEVDVLECDTPNLLGVRDFLENYTLTANYPQKTFSIQDFHTI
ncbi:MAG: hypothetical protein FVQ80_02335 [Planctomycetes bacterium]|nr:hypothetical protein [Planctomycetota bacterium]